MSWAPSMPAPRPPLQLPRSFLTNAIDSAQMVTPTRSVLPVPSDPVSTRLSPPMEHVVAAAVAGGGAGLRRTPVPAPTTEEAFMGNEGERNQGSDTNNRSGARWVAKLEEFMAQQMTGTEGSHDPIHATAAGSVRAEHDRPKPRRGVKAESRNGEAEHTHDATRRHGAKHMTNANHANAAAPLGTNSQPTPPRATAEGGLLPRAQELSAALTIAAAQLQHDEGYFANSAELEAYIMRQLRTWHGLPSSSDNSSNEEEDGTSGEEEEGMASSITHSENNTSHSSYDGEGEEDNSSEEERQQHQRQRRVPSSSPTYISTAEQASQAASGHGGHKIQADLDRVRQTTEDMTGVNSALATLEEEHRLLQRHYIVERSPQQELSLCAAQLAALEGELAAATTTTTNTAATSGKGGRKMHRARAGTLRDKTSTRTFSTSVNFTNLHSTGAGVMALDAHTVAVLEGSLRVCRSLLDDLRQRCRAIVERLTDELLWMRAEARRHDWSAVFPATALTEMAPVSTLPEHGRPSTSSSHANGRKGNEEEEDQGKEKGRRGRALGRRSGNSRASAGAVAGCSLPAARSSAEARDSFLLRVQVPVFASSRIPPLQPLPSSSDEQMMSNHQQSSESQTARTGGGGGKKRGQHASGEQVATTTTGIPSSTALVPFYSSSTAVANNSNQGNKRNAAITNGTSANVSTTATIAAPTVSVVATPSRYALVQLYEACRDFLISMLTRLQQLHQRRTAEAAQLLAERSTLDDYDPAIDELGVKHAAMGRYLAQLNASAEEVQAVHRDLYRRVKMPMDDALQTYERLRTQLLEVLKQRIEEGGEEDLNEGEAEGEWDRFLSRPDERRSETTTSTRTTEREEELEDEEAPFGSQQQQQQHGRSDRSCREEQHQLKNSGEVNTRGSQIAAAVPPPPHQQNAVELDEEAARRSTQPPRPSTRSTTSPGDEEEGTNTQRNTKSALLSSPSRASAKFLGMLDELEVERQRTPLGPDGTVNENEGDASASARPADAESRDRGGTEGETAHTGVSMEDVSRKLPSIVEEIDTISGNTPSTPLLTEASQAVARNAVQPDVESSNITITSASSPPQLPQQRMAGRRRRREDSDDDDHDPVKEQHKDGDEPAFTQPYRERPRPPALMPSVLATGLSSESPSSTSGEESSINNDDSSSSYTSSSSTSNSNDDDAHARGRRAAPVDSQRYGLGSGSTWSSALSAFVTSVVRRAADFYDSDSEEEEEGMTSYKSMRGGAPNSQKRRRVDHS